MVDILLGFGVLYLCILVLFLGSLWYEGRDR